MKYYDNPKDFLDNFDHETYERQWAKEHPERYHFSSFDAYMSETVRPDQARLPRVLIFLMTIMMVGIMFATGTSL